MRTAVFRFPLMSSNAAGEQRPTPDEIGEDQKTCRVGRLLQWLVRCRRIAVPKAFAPSRALLRDQTLRFNQLQTQRTDRGQLPLKLPMSFRRGKCLT